MKDRQRFAMASGQMIDITDLKSEHIHLDDIAHHLSKVQRYGGACPINISYSVAEHCINLYRYVEQLTPGYGVFAIMHDAAEAYLDDLRSPVKRVLSQYKVLENVVEKAIFNRFNINSYSQVKKWDKQILLDEVKVIMPDKYEMYKKETGLEPLDCEILYNNHPATVKTVFLNICKKLGIE